MAPAQGTGGCCGQKELCINQFVHSYVLIISWLNYYNRPYMSLPLKSMQKLQLVWNAVVDANFWSSKIHPSSITVAWISWLVVGFKVQFKFLIATFKSMHDPRPVLMSFYTVHVLTIKHQLCHMQPAPYCIFTNPQIIIKFYSNFLKFKYRYESFGKKFLLLILLPNIHIL